MRSRMSNGFHNGREAEGNRRGMIELMVNGPGRIWGRKLNACCNDARDSERKAEREGSDRSEKMRGI